MTPTEMNTIVVQVNQAFEKANTRIDALEAKIAAMNTPVATKLPVKAKKT
jgi:uncharacterized coiled-coil protein SlyX